MTEENLSHQEGIQKLKELSEDARICMFCTELDEQPIMARPMSLRETDADGNLWFISKSNSNKNVDIKQDSRVQLFFMDNDDLNYLSVYGEAHIYHDKNTIEEKWTPIANAWFEGKDDPTVSVIRVSPSSCYYWNSENGTFVSFLKIIAKSITGSKESGDGEKGKIALNH